MSAETSFRIVNAIAAESETLPAIDALFYQYVVARSGLFVRAEDSRLSACIPVAPAQLHGLAEIEPHVTLKLPRIPNAFLRSVLESAHWHYPHEAMYQFSYRGPVEIDGHWNGWGLRMPRQATTPTTAHFEDDGAAVVDLHSHAGMPAFFSSTDDADETGFRLYVVIGDVMTVQPTLCARVGVYGHHWNILPETIFESIEPFVLASHADPDIDDDADEFDIVETPSGLLVASSGEYQ